MKRLIITLALFIGAVTPCIANVIDYSVNQPAFPPAGLTLLVTVTADPSRKNITILNQDVNIVQVWRDINCTGTALSLVVLPASPIAGQLGGSWTSDTFKSCVRVYGTAGSQIAIYTN